MASLKRPALENDRAPFGITPTIQLRRQGSESLYELGPFAADFVGVFERTLREKTSESLLVWPETVHGISVAHALASLARISVCDTQRLTTVFFPWNRNSSAIQKSLLVDRSQIIESALKPLNRIHSQKPQHPAFGYLLALLSMKDLATRQ